jgi:hypothetical protein
VHLDPVSTRRRFPFHPFHLVHLPRTLTSSHFDVLLLPPFGIAYHVFFPIPPLPCHRYNLLHLFSHSLRSSHFFAFPPSHPCLPFAPLCNCCSIALVLRGQFFLFFDLRDLRGCVQFLALLPASSIVSRCRERVPLLLSRFFRRNVRFFRVKSRGSSLSACSVSFPPLPPSFLLLLPSFSFAVYSRKRLPLALSPPLRRTTRPVEFILFLPLLHLS